MTARRKSMEIRRAQRDKNMEKIWTLHLEGLTGAEIIAVTGILKSIVYRLLSKARQIEESEAERRERDEPGASRQSARARSVVPPRYGVARSP